MLKSKEESEENATTHSQTLIYVWFLYVKAYYPDADE